MDISANEFNDMNEVTPNNDIDILMRQTTYTREESIKILNDLGSVEKCIQHYIGIEPKKEPDLSTNQKIFKSIRDFF